MSCQHERSLFCMLVVLLFMGLSGCSEDEEAAVSPAPPAPPVQENPDPSETESEEGARAPEGSSTGAEEGTTAEQSGAVPTPTEPPSEPTVQPAPTTAAAPGPPGPTPEQCLAALESMVAFTTKMGQERPGTAERKEFLGQCDSWPVESVTCLIGAQEPPAVVKCMKPIAELEMRRSRQAMRQKTVEEQSRLLGEEARKRADAVESVLESAGDGRGGAGGAAGGR